MLRHPTPIVDSKLDDACRLSDQPPYFPPEEACPLSLAIFCCLGSFGGIASPSSVSFSFLFFFKLGIGSKPVIGIGRGGAKTLRHP